MIHLELFWSFFQIGLFSIGGGYAAMPLIQHQVVELHPWLTLEQFSDIITISQMTPGPIAINSATFVGLQLGGLPGALVATVGCVLPSCVIVLTLAYVYYRYRGLSMVQGVLAGLRPAVVAMIASASSQAASRPARKGSRISFMPSRTCFRKPTPLAPLMRWDMSFFTSPEMGLKRKPSLSTAASKSEKAQMAIS